MAPGARGRGDEAERGPGRASKNLDEDGFLTGSAMWTMWDTWRTQAETLLSACAHIHNHREDTVITHETPEEILATHLTVSKISGRFT
ncbi:hypothetical protein ACF065_19060 [Streptomyces sp. NPDC015232]|uniref:hypothetical protein n=1 Tax=unclassified Streptomyces TaxID=2593676 RepID=UPI0036F83132